MRIITWNVNGIRAIMRKGFPEILQKMNPDIICIQETKAQDHQVQEALQNIDGYYLYSNSAQRKGYSGTCILSKKEISNYADNIGITDHDQEGRVQLARLEDFNLVNVYVPNGGSKLKRLDYRAEWDIAFTQYLNQLLQEDKPLIVAGDLNVAHQPIDLARPKQNYNKTAGYTQVEIDGFKRILDLGLKDLYRVQNPDKQEFTYWSMRFGARERNVGWRIDYFLTSDHLNDSSPNVKILGDIQGSDHCPVLLTLE